MADTKIIILSHKTKEFLKIDELAGEWPEFMPRGLVTYDYGMYSPPMAGKVGGKLSLTTIRLPKPVAVPWVMQAQKNEGRPVHPFTHLTNGLDSVETYRPPFHAQVRCKLPHKKRFLPCPLWFLNTDEDNKKDGTTPVVEHDMAETGFSWKPREWYANHHAEPYYKNRVADVVETFFISHGVNQYDLYVWPTHSEKYVNGYLVQRWIYPMDWNYRAIVTTIVNSARAGELEWEIEKIVIRPIIFPSFVL